MTGSKELTSTTVSSARVFGSAFMNVTRRPTTSSRGSSVLFGCRSRQSCALTMVLRARSFVEAWLRASDSERCRDRGDSSVLL
eukprot:scaffold5690_cov190-Pinguiococcus_pyrenoidosus.AAC.1